MGEDSWIAPLPPWEAPSCCPCTGSGIKEQLVGLNPSMRDTRSCGLCVPELSLQMCHLSCCTGFQPWSLVHCPAVMTPKHPGLVLPLVENLAGSFPCGRAEGWMTEALVSERCKCGSCLCRHTWGCE